MFGTMAHAEAIASVRSFADEVMPAVQLAEATAA
jgi:hypothetical protein